MTHEEIAEQLYDELQHNKIVNYEEYSKRLYELLDLAHPDEERVGDYVGEVENIMHNKWSFGFCEMCGDVIFYDDDCWYDLWGTFYEAWEREKIEEKLPKIEQELGHEVQDICTTCFHKIVDDEERS